MSALMFLLWPVIGVAHFLWATWGNEKWNRNPGFMTWGLFLAFICGPLMVVGFFLSGVDQ